MKYLISYDLNKIKNYPRLYKALNDLRAESVHASLWGVETHLSIDQVYTKIDAATDRDDEILVFPAHQGYLVRQKNLSTRARMFFGTYMVGALGGLFGGR